MRNSMLRGHAKFFTLNGYSFVSSLNPFAGRSSFPRYSSLVPPAYSRAVSIWGTELTTWSCVQALQCETYFSVAMRLKYVQNFLDICEVMYTGPRSAWGAKCHSSLQGFYQIPAHRYLVLQLTITTLSALFCSTGDILILGFRRLVSVGELGV